ncbi:TRAP transporter TatT component family protein [Sinobacterium caligoides]|uniref:TRAP transporter TatT component family protein n=2 Tax=Sinobacterium caligoides TaxID=933926 RepID=A0A3N2DNV1_9GAMM|nr:TRAP transporter TatT component family protein [Sinobacterium caligoides]
MFRIFVVLGLTTLAGCSSLIESQTSQLADNLSNAVYNNDDLATVETALPTFIVMVDGLIEGSPESVGLLSTGASLNGAMAANFVSVDDMARKQRLVNKSRAYALRAACAQSDSLCALDQRPFDEFSRVVAETDADDLPVLYTLGVSWLGWLQVHSGDWNAVAQLPKAQLLLERVVELDDGYDHGMAHLYLGGIATLLPPALGGKPDVGREHFERAIALSEGKNLMAKVVYAQQYARLVFDQELHHRLLTEVLEADPNSEGFVLINAVAQQQATALLASEADYF